jgi:hypothetical protein
MRRATLTAWSPSRSKKRATRPISIAAATGVEVLARFGREADVEVFHSVAEQAEAPDRAGVESPAASAARPARLYSLRSRVGSSNL